MQDASRHSNRPFNFTEVRRKKKGQRRRRKHEECEGREGAKKNEMKMKHEKKKITPVDGKDYRFSADAVSLTQESLITKTRFNCEFYSLNTVVTMYTTCSNSHQVCPLRVYTGFPI